MTSIRTALALLLLSLSLGACKQGRGETCFEDDDCSGTLVCCVPGVAGTRGTCLPPGATCATSLDLGPAPDYGPLTDMGPDDAGPDDAGPDDAGPEDAGPEDAGPEDAATADAATADAGGDDAGSEDMSTPDM